MSFQSVSRFAVVFFLFAIAFPMLSAWAADMDGVELTWGIREIVLDKQKANGTVLYEANGAPFTVEGFNARYEMRLFEVGDGTFDETVGFSSMRFVEATNATDTSTISWETPEGVPHFGVLGRTKLPVSFFGEWVVPGDLDDYLDEWEETLDRELTPDEIDELTAQWNGTTYYNERWTAAHFVTVARDKATGKTYRISETPGGTNFLALERFGGTIDLDGQSAMDPDGSANKWHMTVHCDSKSAYLGAPLPARCVWMTDLGLTTNDLAGVSERRIALATALGKTPAEVADVTLEIDGIELANGSVSYAFDVVAPNGTTNAVTALKYGAELRLLGGTELGRWTTTNAVDVTGRTVAVPTDGNARFYRLELATP